MDQTVDKNLRTVHGHRHFHASKIGQGSVQAPRILGVDPPARSGPVLEG
jgi:hypothetical protein